MHIVIKFLTGKFIIIDDIHSDDTVLSVKKKIANRENIPENVQRLIFQGRQLNDDLTLFDCSSASGPPIEDGSTLHLVERLRPEDMTEIFVRTVATGLTARLVVRSPRHQIQQIKHAIELQNKIAAHEQRLI